MIWDKLLFKIRVSFDGMVSRKRVLLEYNQHLEIHIDVFVEVIEVQISVDFELCIDEEFI